MADFKRSLGAPRPGRDLGVAFIASLQVILCASPGQGATSTAQFNVTATVAPTCLISAADLGFGVYTGTAINTSTTLTVTCTNTTTYQIGGDNGQNSQFVGVYAKYMAGPSSSKLRYHLYIDSARTIEWGSTAGTNEIAGTGTGAAQTITVYGTVGAGSFGAVPGAYTDTVTATVTY